MLEASLACYGAHRKAFNLLSSALLLFILYLLFCQEDLIVDIPQSNTKNSPPLPRKNIITSRTEVFKNLLEKNVSEFTTSELSYFLSYKEEQYEDRRRTIKAFCDLKGENFGRKVLKNSLIFDPKDGLGYCQIAKVASSTWCNHFITLGKLLIKKSKHPLCYS